MAEKNNELLMKNHLPHLIGTKPILQANDISPYRDDNYENGVWPSA